MKKIKFLFIALIITSCLNLVPCYIYADTEPKKDNKENVVSKDKQEILNLIEEYLKQIEININAIDKKIANTKVQEEFEYYPAIRLNVDTPIFGLTSAVERKLRVKKDISTVDVTSGYSIRNIVKENIIRIPDAYLGAIVVSTKEIKIDGNMTLAQAKLTAVKCIQYLSQVNGVSDYIDTQTNNIFRDYISEYKKTSIQDIKSRTRKVSQDLKDISDKIKKLEFLGEDVSKYKDTYSVLSDELNVIKKDSKNMLIIEADLKNLIKTSLANESNIIDLNTKVTQKYENAIKDIDYEAFLERVLASYDLKYTKMNDYISSSKVKVNQIKNGKKEEVTEVLYNVTSLNTLDSIKEARKEINSELKKLKEESEKENQKEDELVEDIVEKTKEEIEEEKKEKVKKVDTLYNKYKDILSKEYNFYTSNINMLIKDSNDKVSSVIAQINSEIEVSNDIFGYTKYIYIELPKNLEKYINENDIDSVIGLETLIKLLKKEIVNLSENSIKITDLYNDIVEQTQKS